MGFQVSFSIKRGDLLEVNLLSAGDDQHIICDGSTIFLEATVDEPGNLIGHILLWEQLVGSPVLFSSTNQLTTDYPFTESSDKVFRFWIDKGTPYEQFDDIRIFHTPTSFNIISTNTSNRNFLLTLDPPPVQCNDLTGTVIVTAPPPTSLQGEDPAGPTIDVVVDWEHPIQLSTQPYIVQYSVVEDNSIVFQLPSSIPVTAGDGIDLPTGTRTYNGILAEYRVDTLYNVSGQTFLKQSCTQDFNALTIPLTKILNDSNPTSTKTNNRTLNRQLFTNLINRVDNDQQMMHSTKANNFTFASNMFGFIGITDNESSSARSTKPTNVIFSVTRFDPSGIGS